MDAIGGYAVVGEIARGGMGVVYRARDVRLQRDVAIKVLLTGPEATPHQLERFEREGRALARLRHRNIVAVHALGTTPEGQPYLVMDFVEGEDLGHVLKREGPLKPARALAIGIQLANGLALAHEAGILHRDLKPDNVLLRKDVPLLTDFGLAKDLDPRANDATLSQTGRFLGTPGFWPPEQARGELHRIGTGSDVYGLGAILYALLSGGHAPIEGANLMEVCIATADRDPLPLAEHGVDVPPDLEEVVMTCLAKEPQDRFVDAGDLEEALRACEGGPRRREPTFAELESELQEDDDEAVAGADEPEQALQVMALVAGGLLLVAIVFAVWVLGRGSSARETAARAREVARLEEEKAALERELARRRDGAPTPSASPAPRGSPAPAASPSATPTEPPRARGRVQIGDLLPEWTLRAARVTERPAGGLSNPIRLSDYRGDTLVVEHMPRLDAARALAYYDAVKQAKRRDPHQPFALLVTDPKVTSLSVFDFAVRERRRGLDPARLPYAVLVDHRRETFARYGLADEAELWLVDAQGRRRASKAFQWLLRPLAQTSPVPTPRVRVTPRPRASPPPKASPSPQASPDRGITVRMSGRVVDAAGAPLASAVVANEWRIRGGVLSPQSASATTDAAGRFQLTVRRGWWPSTSRKALGVFAANAERTHGGFLGKIADGETVEIELLPLRRVHGVFACPQLPRKSRVVAEVSLWSVASSIHSHADSSGRFEVLLPSNPQPYHLWGGERPYYEHWTGKVDVGREDVDMGTILLTASGIAKSYGKAPPKLQVIDGRNLPPGTAAKTFSLESLRGKWVVLSMGAWLERAKSNVDRRRAQRAHFELVCLALNSGRGADRRESFDRWDAESRGRGRLTTQDVDFPVVLDDGGKTTDAYGVSSYPTYLLIDPEGRLVDTRDAWGRLDRELRKR